MADLIIEPGHHYKRSSVAGGMMKILPISICRVDGLSPARASLSYACFSALSLISIRPNKGSGFEVTAPIKKCFEFVVSKNLEP